MLGHLMAQCIHLTSMVTMPGEDKYLFLLMVTLIIMAMEERMLVDMGNSYMGHLLEAIIRQYLETHRWANKVFRNMDSIIAIHQEVLGLDLHTTRLQIQTFVTLLLQQVEEVAMHVILT